MMGGFGEPVKKKKPAGVGRGQEAYQRQMKSFNGLRGAGAEGVDVYVHREVRYCLWAQREANEASGWLCHWPGFSYIATKG